MLVIRNIVVYNIGNIAGKFRKRIRGTFTMEEWVLKYGIGLLYH